jgi:hypothetical protein
MMGLAYAKADTRRSAVRCVEPYLLLSSEVEITGRMLQDAAIAILKRKQFMTCVILALVAGALMSGCAALHELPADARSAFALEEPLASHTTRMESFTVEAKIDEAISAAEYALTSSRFYVRSEGSTADRRCGEYTTGLYEWAMWSCFYFLPGKDAKTLRGRVIVESWNSFGFTTSQSWHSILAASFQNRLRVLQEK